MSSLTEQDRQYIIDVLRILGALKRKLEELMGFFVIMEGLWLTAQ